MFESSSMSNLALIIIPIIFVLLWLIARGRKNQRQASFINSDYFKGLNYLLNDEQGKALDIFVKLVESNWDIIDTHFALGSIFRKNGEIDKAIKIHQGLMARPSLPEKYRGKVLLELGYDYLGAGWFDRAEGLFKEVLIHDKRSVQARHNLILIYQQEKDWHKAIDIATELFRENPSEIGPMIAQYYCELAEASKNKGDLTQLETDVEKALRYDSNCVRATFMLAELLMQRKDYKKAVTILGQLEKQDPEFIPMMIEPITECYHQMQSSEELLAYLKDIEKRHPDIFLLDRIARVVDRYKGKGDASRYLLNRLKDNPSLTGMLKLLEYKSSESDNTEKNVYIEMRQAVDKLQQDKSEFLCRKCGFQANTLYWFCPSCHSWSMIKPAPIEKT